MKIKKSNWLSVFIAVGAILIQSCTNGNKSENSATNTDTILVLNNIEKCSFADSIVYDNELYPIDSLINQKLLPLGDLHHEELFAGADSMHWLGLIKRADKYYLESTDIKLTSILDPIVDEDTLKPSGWHVEAATADKCIMLMPTLTQLKIGEIASVNLMGKLLYPGDSLCFDYLGKSYKMYATATFHRNEKIDKSNNPEFWNYKLFISAVIDGKLCKNLLVAANNLSETMIEVLFAGDLDGDGKIDLLLNTSSHYNAFVPTLFLSGAADDGKLVKPVAFHVSLGC